MSILLGICHPPFRKESLEGKVNFMVHEASHIQLGNKDIGKIHFSPGFKKIEEMSEEEAINNSYSYGEFFQAPFRRGSRCVHPPF